MTSGKFAAWLRSSNAASWVMTGQANTVTAMAAAISTSSDSSIDRDRAASAAACEMTTSMRICRPSQATAQHPVKTQPTMRKSMISSAQGIDTLKK